MVYPSFKRTTTNYCGDELTTKRNNFQYIILINGLLNLNSSVLLSSQRDIFQSTLPGKYTDLLSMRLKQTFITQIIDKFIYCLYQDSLGIYGQIQALDLRSSLWLCSWELPQTKGYILPYIPCLVLIRIQHNVGQSFKVCRALLPLQWSQSLYQRQGEWNNHCPSQWLYKIEGLYFWVVYTRWLNKKGLYFQLLQAFGL